jgi:hypothetical protein
LADLALSDLIKEDCILFGDNFFFKIYAYNIVGLSGGKKQAKTRGTHIYSLNCFGLIAGALVEGQNLGNP